MCRHPLVWSSSLVAIVFRRGSCAERRRSDVHLAARPALSTAEDDQLGGQVLNDLVPLIACQDPHGDGAAIRPRLRWLDLKDFAFDLKRVPGPRWLLPRQLPPRTDHPLVTRQTHPTQH